MAVIVNGTELSAGGTTFSSASSKRLFLKSSLYNWERYKVLLFSTFKIFFKAFIDVSMSPTFLAIWNNTFWMLMFLLYFSDSFLISLKAISRFTLLNV